MVNVILRSVFCASLACLCLSATAAVRTLDIETQGSGLTLSEAVNTAIVEAISQVNGKEVESTRILASLEASSESSNNSEFLSSSAYMKQVRESTSGAVESYQVIAKSENSDGSWTASVRSQISVYEAAVSSKRKRIAVMPLRVLGGGYRLAGQPADPEAVGRVVNQKIVDALVQTRKFTVLDREHVDEVKAEAQLIASGDMGTSELARLGEKLAADFLLVGTIEDFTYVVSERKMKTSERLIITGAGAAEVSFRLIEFATGQVMVSETIRSTIDRNAVLEKGSTSPELIASVLAGVAGQDLTSKLLGHIYPILVVSASESGDLVLGQGGNLLESGATYNVYKYGDKVYDPYTKEYLGRTETLCCKVRIDRVLPKQSYATLLTKDADIFRSFEPKTFVLREKVLQDTINTSEKIRKMKQKNENHQSNDSDW